MLLLLPFTRTAICNHRTPVVQHCSAMSWGLLLLKLRRRRRRLGSGSLWPLRLPICPRTRCEHPHLIGVQGALSGVLQGSVALCAALMAILALQPSTATAQKKIH